MSELRDSVTSTVYLSRTVWLTYLILLLIVVPWYWRFFPGAAMRIWCGVPMWVAVSVVATAVVSVFTAWLLLTRRWPGEDEADNPYPHTPAGSLEGETTR